MHDDSWLLMTPSCPIHRSLPAWLQTLCPAESQDSSSSVPSLPLRPRSKRHHWFVVKVCEQPLILVSNQQDDDHDGDHDVDLCQLHASVHQFVWSRRVIRGWTSWFFMREFLSLLPIFLSNQLYSIWKCNSIGINASIFFFSLSNL